MQSKADLFARTPQPRAFRGTDAKEEVRRKVVSEAGVKAE
jgi:hypothetical protein